MVVPAVGRKGIHPLFGWLVQPASTVFFSHAKSAQPPASQPSSSIFLSRQISPATSHQPAERDTWSIGWPSGGCDSKRERDVGPLPSQRPGRICVPTAAEYIRPPPKSWWRGCSKKIVEERYGHNSRGLRSASSDDLAPGLSGHGSKSRGFPVISPEPLTGSRASGVFGYYSTPLRAS